LFVLFIEATVTLTIFSPNADSLRAHGEVWKRAHGHVVVAFWQINTREM